MPPFLPQINENGVVSFGNPVPLYSEDKIVLPIGKDPEVGHVIFGFFSFNQIFLSVILKKHPNQNVLRAILTFFW